MDDKNICDAENYSIINCTICHGVGHGCVSYIASNDPEHMKQNIENYNKAICSYCGGSGRLKAKILGPAEKEDIQIPDFWNKQLSINANGTITEPMQWSGNTLYWRNPLGLNEKPIEFIC